MLILISIPGSAGPRLWTLRNRRTHRSVPAAGDAATVLRFFKGQADIEVNSSHAQASRPPWRRQSTRRGHGGPADRTLGPIFLPPKPNDALSNLRYALALARRNAALVADHPQRVKLFDGQQPTLPISIAEKRRINPFLRLPASHDADYCHAFGCRSA